MKIENTIPFDEYNVPSFPVQCLAVWLSSYVESVTEKTQTLVDMAAVIGLSIMACALSKGKRLKANKAGLNT